MVKHGTRPEGQMTKGKRHRKREQRIQPAQRVGEAGSPVGAIPTGADGGGIEGDRHQAAESEGERNMEMPLKAAIGGWIHGNANAVIALFTVVIAVIAGIQACIYSAQIDWTRIDERAWLAIRFTPFDGPTVGARLPAPIVATNIGKTVAKNINGWIFFRPVPIGTTIDVSDYARVRPSSLPEGEPIPAWTTFKTGVMYPNDPVLIPHGVFARTPVGKTVPDAAIWDQALEDQWMKGDTYLALNGKFTYDDAAGDHHWTTFCNVFVAASSGKNISRDTSDRCVAYNSVDNNK